MIHIDILSDFMLDKALAERLDTFCDFRLSERLVPPDAEYIRVDAPVQIFATDSVGGIFGTLSGAVYYISPSCLFGKLADSMADFLTLIVFYPFWRELISPHCHYNEQNRRDVETEFKKARKPRRAYEVDQRNLAQRLCLTHDPDCIARFYRCLSGKPDFTVYAAEDGYEFDALLIE